MGQAFISYSRRDKDKVYAICDILADAGFPHWLDKEDIPTSEQWRAKIVEGIKNSDSFILFISPASISSPNVVAELNIASEQEHKGNLKIIPVFLMPTDLTEEVEYQLSGIQRIDLSEEFTNGLGNLLKTLGDLTLPKGYKKHLLSYLPGTYITPNLISPLPNPSKEVVIGKTINIKQIRDQRFMPRPKAIVNALRELDSHIKEQEKNKEDEIFTFWIHGRSGSGKSVILLQLMQEIVLQRHAQVFWFYSDESEKLYDFFEKWAEQGIDLNEPLFVFIDDLNTPLTRDLMENRSISSLLRNPSYSNANWPIIVTCSPPEYLEDFRNGGKDEGFKIKEWGIPVIGDDESKQLIQWFETRTGNKPKTGKAFEQSEGLALSMLFELWYYAQYKDLVDKNEDVMRAFGLRFKTRLDSLNLTDAIAPILALNRLYIWPPNSWLDELTNNQRDAFNILLEDKDFSILSIEKSPSGYVRLTHPHLSDVIYQAIRPKNTSKITRAHDLAFSFGKALETNIVIANQLLRVVAEKISDKEDRLASAEIDIDELAKLFAKLWVKQHTIGEDNKSLLAYIWTNWAIWNSKFSGISKYLDEEYITEKGLQYLGNKHRYWGTLWQSLWKCSAGNSNLIQSAIVWLLQYSEEPSWSFIWQTLLKHGNNLPVSTTMTDLITLGINWLKGREDRDQWSFVWQELLKHVNNLPPSTTLTELLAIGVTWLNGHEDRDQWAFVWQDLVEHANSLPASTTMTDLLTLGINWLNGREDRDQWSFIWQALLKHGNNLPASTTKTDLFILGLVWLEGHEDRDQWSFVWQDLLKHAKSLPESTRITNLLAIGLTWLKEHKDHTQWFFVWKDLLKYSKNLPATVNPVDLLSYGLLWLEEHKDHTQWTFVWKNLAYYRKLLEKSQLSENLFKLGYNWINENKEKNSWPAFFSEYIQKTKTDTSFKIQGIQWIEEHRDSKAASLLALAVAQYVYASLPIAEKLRFAELTKSLLFETDINRNDWAIRWTAYWEVLPTVETVLYALRWMEFCDGNIDGAKNIINKLSSTKRIDVLKRLVRWLKGHEDRPQWFTIWQAIIKKDVRSMLPEDLDEIIASGILWLYKNPKKPNAFNIALEIANFYERIPEQEKPFILSLIKNLIDTIKIDNTQWISIWLAYWKMEPTAECVYLALKWIKNNPENEKGAKVLINTLTNNKQPYILNLIKSWYENHLDHPLSETLRIILTK